METTIDIIVGSWQVLGQMSWYLLFGFLIAGFLSVCLKPEWIERHLGGGGFRPIVIASLFGVPLPLCSCSVLPVAASLRRHGASRAATTSFLLSTPQTGVDSIAITYALLGPVLAIFRPLAALATGLLGGGFVRLADRPNRPDVDGAPESAACTEACCRETSSRSVVLRAIHYGFVVLPRDIGVALLIGVVVAGALTVLVPEDALAAYLGGGVTAILLLMVAGVPIYVCATASVPIAAGFIQVGASPGAALAFLIAGPATNAAAFTTIWKVLGRNTALLYLATVAVSAVGCGLLLDAIPGMEASIPPLGGHEHGTHGVGWLEHLGAVALLAVLALSSRMMFRHGTEHDHAAEQAGAGPAGRHIELTVTGLTCRHCVETVCRGMTEQPGVTSATVDLATGRTVVAGEDLDAERLIELVAELGYSAVECEPKGSEPG